MIAMPVVHQLIVRAGVPGRWVPPRTVSAWWAWRLKQAW